MFGRSPWLLFPTKTKVALWHKESESATAQPKLEEDSENRHYKRKRTLLAADGRAFTRCESVLVVSESLICVYSYKRDSGRFKTSIVGRDQCATKPAYLLKQLGVWICLFTALGLGFLGQIVMECVF